MNMDGGVPIVGIEPSDQEQTLLAYIQTIEGFIALHQGHVMDAEAKLNAEYKRAAGTEAKTVNGLYLEIVQARMATHCAAITQATGQLALMAAMGVNGIPAPPGVEVGEEEKLN